MAFPFKNQELWILKLQRAANSARQWKLAPSQKQTQKQRCPFCSQPPKPPRCCNCWLHAQPSSHPVPVLTPAPTDCTHSSSTRPAQRRGLWAPVLSQVERVPSTPLTYTGGGRRCYFCAGFLPKEKQPGSSSVARPTRS